MAKNKKTRKSENENNRSRAFATVVYPESAPQNWLDTLKEKHVAALVSPLHELDSNPDGELKKAHYHVLLMFETVKRFDTQVQPIFDEIGAVGRETVNSTRGYARYLCHLDNPEKVQYNPADVVEIGGANYIEICHLPTDNPKALANIFIFIDEHDIRSYDDLCRIFIEMGDMENFALITMKFTMATVKFLKSRDWRLSHGFPTAKERLEIQQQKSPSEDVPSVAE